ncbi:MAG: TlpA disulfide reductase family protein [Thermodesulfobacteriota bacterium]
MRWHLYFRGLVLAAAMALAAACGSSSPPGPEQATTIVLPDLTGQEVSLSKFKGRVILLNFWATWCPPCVAEVPDFVDLQNEFGPLGLSVVGVSMDSDDVSEVKAFTRKYRVNYPVLYAGKKAKETVRKIGGMRGIPTTLLIDRQGRVVQKITGAAPKETWAKEIKRLL